MRSESVSIAVGDRLIKRAPLGLKRCAMPITLIEIPSKD